MSQQSTASGSDQSTVIFYDDFAQDTLDRSHWNVRVTGPVFNDEQQAYIDSPETLYIVSGSQVSGAENGRALALHPRYREGFVTPEGNTFDFISGRIDTRDQFEFMYGKAEARMRLSAGTGLWPAFWAMGNDQWPDTGEIDIMENIGESDWVGAAVHGPGYSGEDGLVNYRYFPPGQSTTDWHVYAVDWTSDQMLFTVDDNLIYRVTSTMTGFLGPWVFDNSKFLILNFALGGIYPFKINGVKTPYYGLPQQTVDTIKADQALVMVDWVRVTQHRHHTT